VRRPHSLLTCLVLLAGCCGGAQPAEQDEGAVHVLPELNGVGLCQSPINISSLATAEGHHEVSLDYRPSHEHVINKGHTVELEYDEGSTLTLDGKVYEFRQFHFHTPSEHQIDGVTYPLEMHLVHTLRGEPEVYMVIGILFKEGPENAFLAKFLDDVPAEPQGEVIRETTIDVRELATGDGRYYAYHGSLTTPPYTETVSWAVVARIHLASRAQIARFRALEGNNARHVQPLHGRTVEGE
jgi:carbonic anhydrase